MLAQSQQDIIKTYINYYKGLHFVVDEDYMTMKTRITVFAKNTKEMVSMSILVDEGDEISMGRILLDLVNRISAKIIKDEIPKFIPRTEDLRYFRKHGDLGILDPDKVDKLGLF